MELPYYWHHRAKVKAGRIAKTLHDLEGEAQDIVALVAQDPEGCAARGVRADDVAALLERVQRIGLDYAEISRF